MKIVIPGLVDLPCTTRDGIATYEVQPGAFLEVRPLAPLPMDLASWGSELVFDGVERERVKLVVVDEQQTETGWPLTLALSELRDAAGTVVEYRLHLLFRFLEMGGITILRTATEAGFAQAFEAVKPLVGYARPDFSADQVPALALVWAHL